MSDDHVAGSVPSWPVTPEYPPDLFRGTARYYALYRPTYPASLLDDLRTRAGLSGSGRLLDLACGTGEVALALHGSFREVWAIDLEPEMVDVGREKASRAGVGNVQWMVGRAEDVDPSASPFEMVSVGNAFHRLDRRLIARRAPAWLARNGFLAVLGSSSLWSGTAEWQGIASEVVARFTSHPGPARVAARDGVSAAPRRTHEAVLQEAGFLDVREYQFPTPHVWTLDSFLGYLRSTSVGSTAVRAGVADELEDELRQRLLGFNGSGRYEETIAFYYILARRPSRS